MRVRDLMAGVGVVRGSDAIDVSEIVVDSKKVISGSLFVAIKGIARDGHDFLEEAVWRGAAALVVEDETRVPLGFAGVVAVVPHGRTALNQLANKFFGDPAGKLFSIGVTGTDGKTTVTWMIEAVLRSGGMPTGVIGTVDHHFGEHTWPGDTTPPPLVLQKRLAQFVALGARAVAMEATSQGLSQSRLSSVPLDVAVFTNLTRDHLDYHGTLEAYFEAKARLFTEVLAATPKLPCHAIINIDTPYGVRVRVPAKATKWTYGELGSGADLTYEAVAMELSRSIFRLRAWGREAELSLPMMGKFNAANALAAIAVGIAAGYDFGRCVEALRDFAGVPGRAQRVAHRGSKRVFVDYAHDPDAFEKLLGVMRDVMRRERPEGQLVTVFGCGGDRDRGKRPLMLEAALRSSDQVVITLDNPRSEDPETIVSDILAGRVPEEERVFVELDRAKAIRFAVRRATEHDVIMILGKGHEPYQIIGDERLPFSDYTVAEAELNQDAARPRRRSQDTQ